MAVPPRHEGDLDPDELGRREFSRHRKGFDPLEVRAHLLLMAGELKRLQAAEFDLTNQVRVLEERLAERIDLDEERVAALVGEETTRVLEAARTAAKEIRAKAEENAARLVKDAQEQANRTTREAEELRQAASRESDEVLAAARVAADELVAEARRSAAELRETAEAEARSVRERAAKAAADLKAEAEAEAERLRNAAREVRAEAEERAAALRRDAEEAAAAMRTAAQSDAEVTRAEAEATAERIRSDAAAAAAARLAEAEAAAESSVELARERGRAMVEEAREARERMLRDLAERRRAARQQLEALRAGRERLLEAFQAARKAFEGANTELVEALPAARLAADQAARAVDDDLDAAVAELEAELDGGEATEEESSTPAHHEPDVVSPATSSSDAETTEDGSHLRLITGNGGDVDDEDLDDEDFDHEDRDESGSGRVEEIFARLRAGAEAAESEDLDSAVGPDGSDAPDAVVIDLAVESSGHQEEVPGDQVLLDRRDEVLAELERAVVRRLKRVLSDQENATLHTLRSDRKRRSGEDLLGAHEAQTAALVEAAVSELTDAVAAGAAFFDSDHEAEVDARGEATELSDRIVEWMVDPLRERLMRAIEDGDDDREAMADRVRAAYREWKNDKVAGIGGDLASLAFNRGILRAANPGVAHCWVVDHGGLPCPDAEDNHLAGPVIAGEPFPTGDLAPPAHPGCRCLLGPPPR